MGTETRSLRSETSTPLTDYILYTFDICVCIFHIAYFNFLIKIWRYNRLYFIAALFLSPYFPVAAVVNFIR
jgi:hypothetical protein